MPAALVPPGPRGLPFIGNLQGLRRDPLAFFTDCARRFGDVTLLHFGTRRPVYFINHPDLIEFVLVTGNRHFQKSPVLRQSSPLLGNGLLTSEGDFWRRQRRLVQPAFHPHRIDSYAPAMVDYTLRGMAPWRDGAAVDMAREMMRITLTIAAATLFSAEVGEQAETVRRALTISLEEFQRRTRSVIRLPQAWPTPANRRAAQAVRELDGIIYGIIEARRGMASKPDDLLTRLLLAQDEDGAQMTDRQLRDEAMTIFLAGHETTANALAWTWYLLSQHPRVEAALHAELDAVLGGRAPTLVDVANLTYTHRVITESMRLWPPAWALSRLAIDDVTLGEYPVAAGSIVFMSMWVTHRDARWFEAPAEFRPERWEGDFARRLPGFAYFPFGGGPRLCIGKPFALLEAVLLLATMAQRWRFRLSPQAQIEPQPMITLRPRYGMPGTLVSRA